MTPSRRLTARIPAVAAACALLVASGTACSDDTRRSIESDVRSAATDVADAVDATARDAAELVARNIAGVHGADEFAAAGHTIEGHLDCSAEADGGLSQVMIECTGTTVDGASVELIGTTSELPGASVLDLEGEFVGTVDGDEVFTTEHLGG